MSRPTTDYEIYEQTSPETARHLFQERLILKVTQELWETLERRKLSKADLAREMGRTAGFVSQLLSGDRNLTLRTLADVARALRCEVDVRLRQPSGLRKPLFVIETSMKGDVTFPRPSTEPAGVSQENNQELAM